MAKTTMIHARVDTELKESVEEIFSQLGTTSSDAIKLFLNQVKINRGFPFEIKLPNVDVEEEQALAQLLSNIRKSKKSAESGEIMTLAESRAKLGV